MRNYFIVLLLLAATITVAQPGKKPVQPKPANSQPDMNKMLEEAMKQGGISDKEKEEIRKAMGQAQQVKDQMQQNGITGNMISADVPQIPAKQTVLLSKIPTIKTETAFKSYLAGLLADCKKNMPATVLKAVDDFFSANNNNEAALANISPFLLMQQKPLAAIYASVKIATLKPEQFLQRNNMGVILHQTGYAEMAIPVFQYLLTTHDYAEILNNLAQCYLNLGDIENARKYFMACLVKNPSHSSAHCGMGLILSHEGNIAEATQHIIQSLKSGYSETAEALMKKHKMKINYEGIKPAKAEYFNPQKYKPVPPAKNVDELEMIDMQRQSFNEFYQQWQRKTAALATEQNEKKERESVAQGMNRVRGYVFKTPLSRKAKLITDLLMTDYYNFSAGNPKAAYLETSKSLYKELEATMKKIDEQTWEGVDKDCERRKEAVNKYLLETAENHEACQRKTLYKHYDWVNENLQWKRFLLSGEEYQRHMYDLISEYFRTIDGYNDVQQIYPIPLNVVYNCKNTKQPDKKPVEDSVEVEEEDCPVKFEIPFGVGKAKVDCKGYEVEGGEVIMLGVEKEYRSGEITFFLGLGLAEYAKGFGVGGVEAGIKAGSFVKIGKGLEVLDCGDKAEAGIEGGIGPFMTEVKATGTMGMESGINVETNTFGKETKIFHYGGKE